MSWNDDVRMRFSTPGLAHRWNDMYASATESICDHNYRLRRDFTLDFIDREFPKNGTILDLGCGAGPVLSGLSERGISCIGVDYSLDMLGYARDRVLEQSGEAVGIASADCQKLPFRAHAFDGIVCLGVISYVQDYRIAIREICRVLRPGGTLILSFRNRYNRVCSDPVYFAEFVVSEILNLFGVPPEKYRRRTVGRYLPPGSVMQDLEACDFEHLHFQGIGFGPLSIKGKRLFTESISIKASDYVTKVCTSLDLEFPFWWLSDISILACQKRKS